MISKIFTTFCFFILMSSVGISSQTQTEAYQVSPDKSRSSDEGTPKGSAASSVDGTPVKAVTPIQLLSEATKQYRELKATGIKSVVDENISSLFERAAIGFYAAEEFQQAARAYKNAAITTADLNRKETLYGLSSGCYTEAHMIKEAQETENARLKVVRAQTSGAASQPVAALAAQPMFPSIGRRNEATPLPQPLPTQKEENVSDNTMTLAVALKETQDPLEKAKLYAKAAKQFMGKGEHEQAALLYIKGARLDIDTSLKTNLARNAGEEFCTAADKEPAGNNEKQSQLYQNAGQCFYGIEDFRRAVQCYGIAKELTSDSVKKEDLYSKIKMCYKSDRPVVASSQPTPAEHIQKAEEFLARAKLRVKELVHEKANDSKASELFEAAANRFHLGGDDKRAAKYYDRAQDRAISSQEVARLSGLAFDFYTRVGDQSNAERMAEINRRMENRRQLVEQRQADDLAFEQTAAENRRLREMHMRTLGLVKPDGTGNRDLPWPVIQARYKELTKGGPKAKYLENFAEIKAAYEWLDQNTTKS